MNLVQSPEDTVICITFAKESASENLTNALKDHASYFRDNLHDEHMYGITVTDDLAQDEDLLPEAIEELSHIRKLMDEQNASYFRFI